MSRRQHRVEELLRREIAQMLLRGELRDPRLQPASAVGITGVQVSADLSVATVYVDVLSDSLELQSVLAAFRAAQGLIRHKLSDRVTMRRSPELRFAYDSALARGNRVEEILAEIGAEVGSQVVQDPEPVEAAPSEAPAAESSEPRDPG